MLFANKFPIHGLFFFEATGNDLHTVIGGITGLGVTAISTRVLLDKTIQVELYRGWVSEVILT